MIQNVIQRPIIEWKEKSYQVCAVGRVPKQGEAAIWSLGESSASPPGGNCEDPVVNWSKRDISSEPKFVTAVQNQESTF